MEGYGAYLIRGALPYVQSPFLLRMSTFSRSRTDGKENRQPNSRWNGRAVSAVPLLSIVLARRSPRR